MTDDYPADTVASMALWLLRRTDRIRQHPAAMDAVNGITRHVAAAQRAIDRPAELAFLGECDTCQTGIYAAQRARWAVCACGATYDVAVRREELLARAQDILGNSFEISRALTGLGRPVTPAVIRALAFRGRIAQRGMDARRYPLYRVGDVVEVISRDNESPRGRANAPGTRPA